jgi:hypothetical protein
MMSQSTGIDQTWCSVHPGVNSYQENRKSCNIYLPPSNVVTDCVGEAGPDPTWLKARTVTS